MGEKVTESSEFDIRYSVKEDVALLKQWLQDEEMMRWYPLSSAQDAEIMTTNWIGFAKFQASLTATYSGQPVGMVVLFLMPYRKVAHHSMMYLAVDPAMQRKGIGTALIRNANHLAVTQFHLEAVHVELYDGCPAIQALKKEGYREIVRQEKAVKEGANSYRARLIFECLLSQGGAKSDG